MNPRGIVALVLVILVPLTGYWMVKLYSKDAIHMPPHYFYDSIEVTKDGAKTKNDTIWHKVKGVKFTNQLGKTVHLQDLKGKVIVMNFFFTHCPTICPGLTVSMKKLQASFLKNPDIVQFISVSVDPDRDSVVNLRKYADRFNINHDTWWMLTGNKKEIYDFAFSEMKASIADTNIDTAFIHTEKFFLLDTNYVIRGWYDGFDTTAQAKLARDIPILMLEKDRKKSSILRGFIPLLPIIFIGIAIVCVIIILLNRKRN